MAGNLNEAQRWLARARRSLKAAETLVEQSLFEDAVSRAYYAMFYAVKALLIKDDLPVSSKHSAVVAAFGREYA